MAETEDLPEPRRRGWIRWAIYAAVVIAAGIGAWLLWFDESETALTYRTETVQRGNLSATVSATGTLSARITVEVGTQVSGQIAELLVDYNDRVERGQVIARIEPSTFRAQLSEAEAQLAVARATVQEREAALRLAELDLARREALRRRGAGSQADLDRATSERDAAAAQLAVARATVAQRESMVEARRIDLERTVIRSPINGVIISRNVNVGQTVAASLQAPILFTIAQDLSEMQVEVRVDEADIGRVQAAERASFTVDAYPGQEFPGAVRQVRLQPSIESNVVTYTVVVMANNPRRTLLPGMTANVTFVVGEREDVLMIPNAALRFQPPESAALAEGETPAANGGRGNGNRTAQRVAQLTQQLSLSEEQQAQVRAIYEEVGRQIRAGRQQGAEPGNLRERIQQLMAQASQRIEAILTPEQRERYQALQRQRGASDRREAAVWQRGEDGRLRRVPVVIGLSDGQRTELLRGELDDGAEVITGVERASGRNSTPRLGF